MNQSVLDPLGIQASRIATLWWGLFVVSVSVFVLVMLALAVAARRGRQNGRSEAAPISDASLTRGVSIAVVLTIVTLFGWLVASLVTGRAISALQAENAVVIDLVGHQWWWEVHYQGSIPAEQVTTANELHVPVHRPVVVKVTSRDVIHSLWIPPLQGKRDLIPGREAALWMQADAPAVLRGQCAEFCGLQHAHMALTVVAESDEAFERWREGSRGPAPPPSEVETRRGLAVFMSSRCAGCHTVRGTDAAALVGPDLTHVASRSTLGAGTLPNEPGDLEQWIRNPQAFKPGTQMPSTAMSADDLRALVSYLETLR